MTQGERVKQVRKLSEDNTLEKFGKKLGVTKQTISRIENGINNLTGQMIKSISREYGVNEVWLRTGEGEMNIPNIKEMNIPNNGKLSLYLGEIAKGNDEFIIELVEAYMELDQSSKDALQKLAYNMAEKRNRRK